MYLFELDLGNITSTILSTQITKIEAASIIIKDFKGKSDLLDFLPGYPGN